MSKWFPTWPSVEKHEGNSILLLGEEGYEVDVIHSSIFILDGHLEVWKRVDVLLTGPPVVNVSIIVHLVADLTISPIKVLPTSFGSLHPFHSKTIFAVVSIIFICYRSQFGQMQKLFEF